MKLIIPVVCLLSSLSALGEEPPKLPNDLVQVKTGAYWEEDQKQGFVRFCAFERGFDHVRHQIVIEWILSPTDPNEVLSVHSRVVVKDIPDVWSVGEAKFIEKDKKRYIEFSATHTYSHEEADFIIELLGIGKIAVTKREKAEHGVSGNTVPPAK